MVWICRITERGRLATHLERGNLMLTCALFDAAGRDREVDLSAVDVGALAAEQLL